MEKIRSIPNGVVVIFAAVIVGLALFFISQKGTEESIKITVSSFLPAITIGEQSLYYFLVIIIVNMFGLYLSDHEIDNQIATKDSSGTGYEYEWKDVIVMGMSSAILTMGLLETYKVAFWMSLIFALLMGIAFRPLLPELAKLASSKIQGFLQVAFGQYK